MERLLRPLVRPLRVTQALLLAASAATAGAQSFNIDFGAIGTQPSATYGAGAAQPGVWNEVPTAASQPLFELGGALTTVNVTLASAQNFAFDNLGTSGDDEALMDTFVDLPTSVTVTGLAPGDYTVITYAWAPDDSTYITNVAVTGSPDPLQPCGGLWPGMQQLGVTYTRHGITVAPGANIEVLFTLGSGFVSCNGMQIVQGPTTIGTNYCSPNPNSTGQTGLISGSGSAVVANNDLTLAATRLPNNAFGYFITSLTQATVANPGGSQGILCIGGQIGRYTGPGQILNTGNTGGFSLLLNLTQIPTPTGPVAAIVGQTRNFQAWHRDAVAGSATSNFTDGLAVTFL